VCHYAADRHVLEQRCAFDAAAWPAASRDGVAWLVALTSIHWREAWKYGERAFRYCQHDLGHAMAATSIAAALAGCRVALVPEWSHRDIAAITGTDRDEDYVDAEREEPGCLLVVGREPLDWPYFVHAFARDRSGLIDAVRRGVWTGRASQLSEDHVQWTFIDDIAQATEDRGRRVATRPHASNPVPPNPINPIDPINPVSRSPDHSITRVVDRRLVLRRRSALALDGRYGVDADRFFTILERTLPGEAPPWDALWWDPRIHLALFVHRVDAVSPGLYMLVRQTGALDRLKAAMTRDFLWQRVSDRVPLFLLARGDCRQLSERVSCDQEIAADGFFSLGMIAEFDASLREFGPSFYRHLFWESGVVGQVLYLAGEAAGARGTGIGCFFDDPVHDVLGFSGHAFQSLYHFTVGMPVEDTRLTTEPGYAWESRANPLSSGSGMRRRPFVLG
jgi:nitroreductase